jgi:hypothetical protein
MEFHHLEREELRLLKKIERLLEFPHLTILEFGDNIMAIGNITAGSTGQFGAAVVFPSGVTPPSGYTPSVTWSSPDSLITFTAATTDLSGGTVPLSQQTIVNVDPTDTNTSGLIGASSTAPDGTIITKTSTFTITPATVTEPTLTITQFA